MDKNWGRTGGFLTVGEVVNVEDDPTQSGAVRVKWQSGSAVQTEVADEDLPWTKVVNPATNPSLDQTGGPHTGLRVGSRVLGIPLDGSGQEFLVLGSLVASGSGEIDEEGTVDSQIPQSAKVAQNGGETQPRYGDVNHVVCDHSICKYAEDQGGAEKKPAKYPSLDDSIGTFGEVIV